MSSSSTTARVLYENRQKVLNIVATATIVAWKPKDSGEKKRAKKTVLNKEINAETASEALVCKKCLRILLLL